MDTVSERPTATIYQFPLRGRMADRREEAKPPVVAAVGGSWYHDAAIQEAERAMKQ